MRVIFASVLYLLASVFGNPAPHTVPAQLPGVVTYGLPSQGPGTTAPYGNTAPQTVPAQSPGVVVYGVTSQGPGTTVSYGNPAPQMAPALIPGGTASVSTSSTPAAGKFLYGTPVTAVGGNVPAVVLPSPAVGVGQPALWANQACKYYGQTCLPLESCPRKLRLPLTGCDYNTVCCNIKKTKHCSKVGGECRWRCKGHGVPYHYASCAKGIFKCCIYVQKKKV
ncbi:uncharacterized protein LOC119383667 isoform X2 [Rhipicephalus sanguineus]|uniref:uncharacterized protein LOC119383667 isoform X2 n=1 Tax=Rhipicephalus sanguineus TaxID=34632 RepID=UPI0020C363AF|nr:uncharacterized protein LOC119383667 isoform X2 [Rhipicephalus sanguineus]